MHGPKKAKSQWDNKRKYGNKNKEISFDESPKEKKKRVKFYENTEDIDEEK